MSHSKEINNSNMNDVEEGEISNDKIISPENIISDLTSTKLPEDSPSQSKEHSQGFFHKLNNSSKKEPNEVIKEANKLFLSQKRESSPPNNYKKPFVKKSLCQYYAKNGSCTKGKNCRFAHEGYQSSIPNVRHNYKSTDITVNKNYKRDLCKYHLNGSCLKGDNCTYSHSLRDFPCKYYQVRGHCDNRDECKKLNSDEMMKFIKDHAQFIDEIKAKYGNTKIDSYLKYYLENKTEVFNEYNESNLNKQMNQINHIEQEWMNMNINSNAFQMQQLNKGMLMGFPSIYSNNIIHPSMHPMQFYPMAMNYGLSIPGQNQFMGQQYYQNQTGIGSNTKMPQSVSYAQLPSNGDHYQMSKNKEINNIKDNGSNSNSISSSHSDIEIVSSAITGKKIESISNKKQKTLEDNKLTTHPVNKTNNQTEELIKKVANAILQTNSIDPRIKNNM